VRLHPRLALYVAGVFIAAAPRAAAISCKSKSDCDVVGCSDGAAFGVTYECVPPQSPCSLPT
jgi:hypothetical protein